MALEDRLNQVERARALVCDLKKRHAEWEERGKREGLAAQEREVQVTQPVGRVEGLEREARKLNGKWRDLTEEWWRMAPQLGKRKEKANLWKAGWEF